MLQSAIKHILHLTKGHLARSSGSATAPLAKPRALRIVLEKLAL